MFHDLQPYDCPPTYLFECHGQRKAFEFHCHNLQIGLNAFATQFWVIWQIKIGFHILVEFIAISDANQSVHLHKDASDAVGGIEAV